MEISFWMQKEKGEFLQDYIQKKGSTCDINLDYSENHPTVLKVKITYRTEFDLEVLCLDTFSAGVNFREKNPLK